MSAGRRSQRSEVRDRASDFRFQISNFRRWFSNLKFRFYRGWKFGGIKFPRVGNCDSRGGGSALIVVLWVLLLLSMLVASFAYDMKIEGMVTSYARNRLKAQELANAGVEWTRTMLARDVPNQFNADGGLAVEDGEDADMALATYNLSRGIGVSNVRKDLGEGSFTISVLPEESRRNVNTLTDQDWDEILDQAGVPKDKWDEIKDCFKDWVDKDDSHLLNGAEKDDEYYVSRGYEPKNGPVDTVDELLLIKGFTPALLYGGASPYNPNDPPLRGIAGLLTTWGDGKVNVNSAGRDVLMSLPGMEDYVVEKILQLRVGPDGQAGTVDDGFKSVQDVIGQTGMDAKLADRISTTDKTFLRIVSVGEVKNVKAGIWVIAQQNGKTLVPVFWREETMQ